MWCAKLSSQYFVEPRTFEHCTFQYHAGSLQSDSNTSSSVVETERVRGAERQKVRKRHGDLKSSKGGIISAPCTVYTLQSIPPPSEKKENSSTFIFSSPLPTLPSVFTHFWYSRHAAVSRWSNSFAAATSGPVSPRQPSISY